MESSLGIELRGSQFGGALSNAIEPAVKIGKFANQHNTQGYRQVLKSRHGMGADLSREASQTSSNTGTPNTAVAMKKWP
jgi:hypothetical protein